MKDAIGGVVNIFFIAIFLALVSGILGFIVNYNKAFHMKNTILSILEQYDGADGCFQKNGTDSDCRRKIRSEAERYGYNPRALNCHGKNSSDGLFCYDCHDSDSKEHTICSVITQVDINIPIVENVLGFDIFQIHGDSRPLR